MATFDRSLHRVLSGTGCSEAWADAVVAEVVGQTAGDTYRHARHAVENLVRGTVSVLVRKGTEPLPLDDVAMNLVRSVSEPAKAATALVLAAVAVGGGLDGKRPAWQHMQAPGNVTRGGQVPSHPVRGVGSPTGARALYNLAIGAKGRAGTTATQARGPADRA